jgi:DNA repair exonuclease SbcCD nuclease subunit
MIRFLHTSDLHLGKPYGRYPEDVRGRLRQARAEVIGRLALAARGAAADLVLIAGDMFDAETPSPPVMRQAMNAMAAHDHLRWIILPGNHDSLAATELWRALAAGGPRNVTLATSADPVAISETAVLLPAPCTTRRPGRDLTETLDQPTAPGLIRIGLAHGAVTDFGGAVSEDGNPAIIPPDRALRSGLDYLALGDWHGQMEIGPRQWYAGTPETDSFKHGGIGTALLVDVAGPGALPVVGPVQTGALDWRVLALDLQSGDDATQRLAAVLPDLRRRVDTLIEVTLTGRLSLTDTALVRAAIDRVAPDFLHCAVRAPDLSVQPDVTDLDRIDHAGALRAAADRLVSQSLDPDKSAADRTVAMMALERLFAFATETS